ncbi:DUF6545 domain-containing protein [Streptomyces sp. MUM 203J]|uniref:DUF6545 domain-containing protein n=1 Tax=Streptomyces sp. MUM 203J TaxID=2791990 RepID=UPI0035ABE9B0
MPHIVLVRSHRGRVGRLGLPAPRGGIEISDGILALRPYRSLKVQETAQITVDAGTERGAAAVEAAVVEAALVGLKAGRLADDAAPPSAEAASRGDLRADTEWLLLVADALRRPCRACRRRRPTGTRWSLRS